jgi:anti-sigma factor RsiW
MSEINESELLSAYLDGETSAEEFNRVNSLLASSSEWRQELERLNATKVSLASAPRLTAPADLVATLLSHPAIARRNAKVSLWRRLFPETRPWVLAGSAGFAAMAFAAWMMVSAPWAPQAIPLQPLLAAHARSVGGEPGLHGTLMAASSYSAQLAQDNAATN